MAARTLIRVSIGWVPTWIHRGLGGPVDLDNPWATDLWDLSWDPELVATVSLSFVQGVAEAVSEHLAGDEPMLSKRELASIVAGIPPWLGAIQSIAELSTGYDYIAGEETSRILAAVGVALGTLPGGKASLKAGAKLSPKAARLLANALRGALSEARTLRQLGLTKNTRRVYSNDGTRYSVPDALNDRELIEIKDVKSIGLTKQLRNHLEYAKREGLEAILYVGPNTHVAEPLRKSGFLIRELPFLGPQ